MVRSSWQLETPILTSSLHFQNSPKHDSENRNQVGELEMVGCPFEEVSLASWQRIVAEMEQDGTARVPVPGFSWTMRNSRGSWSHAGSFSAQMSSRH
jgi:hypothetical protein